MINISEIFYSIQGESTYLGLPCVFIRLAGCNLRCSYCDTTYAYERGKDYEINDIICKIKQYNCKLVEITGGEPLLQNEVFLLIDRLVERKFKVLVETNGTVDISKVNDKAVIVMDIKCPSSGESSKVFWNNVFKIKESDEIKFVIGDKRDYNWARKVINEYKLENKTILFSPVFGKLSIKELYSWVLESNIYVRLQPQLHKICNLK